DRDDCNAVGRIGYAGQKLDTAAEKTGYRHIKRGRSPKDAHHLVEKQDQAEGREHLVKMITLVECSENDDFNRDADQNGGAKRGGEAEEKRAGRRENGGGDIGADHVREPCARLIRFMMPKMRVK